MRYFCITELDNKKHFFLSNIKPDNNKIESYELLADMSKIPDLQKNIVIINSSAFAPSTHNLLFVYMLLSDLCVEETAKKYFTEKASTLAIEHLDSSIGNKN